MAISVFDLFKIGIGPSSSHTVGPMRAAAMFARSLASDGLADRVAAIRVELFGSLGATGHGHGSVPAVVLGLLGEDPETVDPSATTSIVDRVRQTGKLALGGSANSAVAREIDFDVDNDIVLHRRKRLPFHSNAMVLSAQDASGGELSRRTYYSVGGGFVLGDDQAGGPRLMPDSVAVPYPFASGAELLKRTRASDLPISGVVLANELVRPAGGSGSRPPRASTAGGSGGSPPRASRDEAAIRSGLLRIWSVMQECVAAGCEADGVLPGGLKVRRRARNLRDKLEGTADVTDPSDAMELVALYALAANERNAAVARGVT